MRRKFVDGFGGSTEDGLHEPCPAVAEGCVDQLGELPIVGQASHEGLFGLALPVAVAESEAGELLGAGDAGGAVAPVRACRSWALELVAPVFVSARAAPVMS